MHIAHLIDSLGMGGAQKLLVLFAEEAKLRDLKVTVICLSTRYTDDTIVASLKSFGVQVVILSINKLYDPAALPKLLSILRTKRVDILQTHLRHSNILGVLACKLINIPVIATLHSTHANPRGNFFQLRIWTEKLLLRFSASYVVAVGQVIGEIYGSVLVDKKVDIIPNPVKRVVIHSEEERRALRNGIDNNAERFLIFTVGKLKPEKGISDLLTAFVGVSERHPSAMLVVVGDGALLNELKSQATLLGLENNIWFAGARDDVPDLLSIGEMYVSSSYREGLSLAMLEAMAAGLPIVATKVGDTELLLNDGRGVIIPPHNVSAITEAICYLIENPKKMKECGRAARAFVEANYSTDQWMDRLLGLYGKAQINAN